MPKAVLAFLKTTYVTAAFCGCALALVAGASWEAFGGWPAPVQAVLGI